MKNISFLLLAFLLFSSCADDKKKQQENSTKEITKPEEPQVKIENQVYESLWDGIRNESEFEDIYASYTKNRFNQEKKALSMDGMSEYAMIVNQEGLNPKKEITVSFWYRPISFRGSGNDPLIIKAANDVKKKPFVQYMFSVTGNEYSQSQGIFQFALTVDDNYHSLKTKNNIWTPNEWYNLTGSYDGELMKFYVNGVLQNSKKITGALSVFDTNLFVGRKNEVDKFYTPGNYDNLRIYNRALTKEEIMLLAN